MQTHSFTYCSNNVLTYCFLRMRVLELKHQVRMSLVTTHSGTHYCMSSHFDMRPGETGFVVPGWQGHGMTLCSPCPRDRDGIEACLPRTSMAKRNELCSIPHAGNSHLRVAAKDSSTWGIDGSILLSLIVWEGRHWHVG